MPIRQFLWGDAVYVKDFTRLGDLTPEQLLKLAAIVHDVYGSPDLAALALQHRLSVLSRDEHFDVVPGLEREGW